ncbi:UDP-N-acetylmuramoylalanine--D-glutamate ligase [Alishewanella longhuensis]|uniref:UDP-N-acetylmuramoylalanine--D-glutamate ligase n=1 Tax=Alishewanella longhuensis TaxID=1091037 RepID=A0ABQ3L537_9ALTE|nr:UDP-N-acetylmuramoyl-L-alanine--D-glutamate ligase [Alishewanella longhuensis]GHG72295.1 UDP-N-acetylmuramoylalanine--D-glutamate ligase [Alishewanella longhuensis]
MQAKLTAKRIAVVGLGLSGLATVRFLLSKGVKPVLMDTRKQPAALEQISPEKVDGIYLGELDANRLAQMELIIVSPGLSIKHPALRFARLQGAEVIGDVELFARFNTKPVVAITGSNGKSTVTMLVEAMLKQSGIAAVAAGNIGLPVLEAIAQPATAVFVLELSSFQLETTDNLHTLASANLNVSADHLDRYTDMAEYAEAKRRIFRHSKLAIYNAEDALTRPGSQQPELALSLKLNQEGYGIVVQQQQPWLQIAGEALLPLSEMSLFGEHNQFNALVAAALTLAAGGNRQAIAETLRTFKGLSHRCELVAELNGVRWVNDSKATNIGATHAALAGLRSSVAGKLILIAGGDAKGADVTELQAVLTQDVQELITLGQDGPAIAALKPGSKTVKTLQQAVRLAADLAKPGDMVLLSPACASLDMFKSYADRGEQFAKAVKELK